jgi:hypothetical protein
MPNITALHLNMMYHLTQEQLCKLIDSLDLKELSFGNKYQNTDSIVNALSQKKNLKKIQADGNELFTLEQLKEMQVFSSVTRFIGSLGDNKQWLDAFREKFPNLTHLRVQNECDFLNYFDDEQFWPELKRFSAAGEYCDVSLKNRKLKLYLTPR